MSFGIGEILLVLALVVFFFGAKKIPQIAKGVGEGIRNFKQSVTDGKDEGDEERLVLEVPVGAEVLTEIAKLRAIRRLWAEIAEERDLPATLRLLASGPAFPYTRLDPESNLLRATLAGFAALSGGADLLELAPFRADGSEAQ